MLRTIPEAAELLGIGESRLRRAAIAKKVPVMQLGNRLLVDVDAARDLLAAPEGVKIDAVSSETGLTVTAIRRGVREGWIPCTRYGKAFIFQLDEVRAAIVQRMRETQKQK